MGFTIEQNSYIHLGCRFNCARHFTLKRNSVLNQYCHIDNRGGIVIGENVSIAPYVKLVTADHNLYSSSCEGRENPITIHDYVFVGLGAVILAPSELMVGSAIGAHALFKGIAEPYYLYVGNPAIKSKKRPEDLDYNMGYGRLFH